MSISRALFIAGAAKLGVLTPAEIEKLQAGFGPEQQAADADQLARELVQQGKLTRYQAAAIYQDKADSLVLGNYVLLDKLGSGGMGQVFRARHRRMDRVVALKVLPRKALASPDAVARFQREAKASAKLTHPNIVIAHDADEAGGVHFLVMEYVEGSDLAWLVKNQGPLPVPQALGVISNAARGLQHAHAQGVIHRDIKPSNLLVDKHGHVKVLDLGLALLSEAPITDEVAGSTPRGSDLTQSGSVMGTIDYMAPEQAMDTHHADARSDIYSLGCTLHFLLTGQAPFGGDTLMKRLVAHRDAPIPSIRAARPEVSEAVDALFQRMVAKRPEDRPQNMAELLAALEPKSAPVPRALPAAAVPAVPQAPVLAEGKPAMSLPVLLVGGTVAIVTVLIGAMVLMSFLGGGSEQQVAEQKPPRASAAPAKPETPTPSVTPEPAPEVATPPAPATTPAAPPTPPPVAAPVDAKPEPSASSEPAPSPSPAVVMPPAATPVPVVTVGTEPAPETTPVETAPTRLPIPDAQAAVDALAVIKDIFKDDYASLKQPEDRQALVEKLMKQARETLDDATAQYVLLTEARDHAAELGHADLMIQAVDGLGEAYDVDPLKMYVELWQKLLSKPRPSASSKALAETALALAERAVAANNLDAAEELLKLGKAFAQKVRDVALIKQATARSEELTEHKKVQVALNAANATLAKSPDDAAANLILGRHLCFVEGDWEAGLPHLAKSSDAALKDLASKSLNSPTEPADQAALADAWWSHAEAAKGKARTELQAGAQHWYTLALPGLTGLVKVKVEKRMNDLAAAGVVVRSPKPRPASSRGQPPLAVAPFNADEAQQHQASWSMFLKAPVTVENSVGMQLALIPPGEFMMGTTVEEIDEIKREDPTAESLTNQGRDLEGVASEGPQHKIRISRPYWLGLYEVTQEQYQKVMGKNPSLFSATGQLAAQVAGVDTRSFPAEGMRWQDTVDFCEMLSRFPDEQAAGRIYRLPTEAEWEFACRSGTATKWHCGDEESVVDQYAWCSANSARRPHPVGEKLPNAFGLYDMMGNINEWCLDWFDRETYRNSPSMDPQGPQAGVKHVTRGGGFSTHRRYCRSADRGFVPPYETYPHRGFRVLCTSAGP